jgi:hypothetical protein
MGDHVDDAAGGPHRPSGRAVVRVERGAEQVAGGVVEGGDAVPPLPDAAEGVLGQVLGLVPAAGEHIERAEEPPLVGHVEALERQRGADADRDRRGVGGALRCHGHSQHCPKNASTARGV